MAISEELYDRITQMTKDKPDKFPTRAVFMRTAIIRLLEDEEDDRMDRSSI